MTQMYLLFIYFALPGGHTLPVMPEYYLTKDSCEQRIIKFQKEELFVPVGTLVVGKCFSVEVNGGSVHGR